MRRASQTVFGDGLTRLIVLEGTDFEDKKKTSDLVVQLLGQSKSRKRIIVFSPSRFTVQMPASDEHALAAAELCSLLKIGIRTQLFGLTRETEQLPLRINFQQDGSRIISLNNMLMSSCQITGPWSSAGHRARCEIVHGKECSSIHAR